MFQIQFLKIYFRSKTFVFLVLFCCIMMGLRFFLYTQELQQVRDLYTSEQDNKALQIAQNLQEKIKTSYETLRTISLLPGVRKIQTPGEELSAEVRSTVQQLYNNAYVNIQLSEVYILPKAFNYERLSPMTKKTEVLLAIFDELITGSGQDKKEKEEGDKIEQVESFEYQLHVNR